MTMEHTKKLILVEPRVLEQMQSQSHAEYRELQKPADKKNKAGLSVELQQMLEDSSSIGDDLKAKMYRQKFSKFRTMRSEIPSINKGGINPIRSPVVVRTPRRTHTPAKRRQRTWDQY